MAYRYNPRPKRRYAFASALVLPIAVTAGCQRQAPTPSNEAPPTATSGLSPLESENAILSIPTSPHSNVALRIPVGTTQSATVVAVLGVEPDSQAARCTEWFELTRRQAFVLCLAQPEQNLERSGLFEFYDRELRLALRATKRKFGGYVEAKSVTLVGLTDAAEAVVALARKSPSFFARVALVDGGFSSWNAVDVAQFSKIDGAKALLVCDKPSCQEQSTRVATTLKASGTAVRLLPPVLGEMPDAGRSLTFPEDYRDVVTWLVAAE